MRMDVKGVLLMSIGVLANVVIALAEVGRDAWVLLIGGFVSFLAWVFIISGLDSLWEVRKDKRARQPAAPVEPAEPHPGLQEPPKR